MWALLRGRVLLFTRLELLSRADARIRRESHHTLNGQHVRTHLAGPDGDVSGVAFVGWEV